MTQQKTMQILPAVLAEECFIVFGERLNDTSFSQFEQYAGRSFKVLESWQIAQNQIKLLHAPWQAGYLEFAHSLQLDAAPLTFQAKLSQSGLLVMDMDSTIIQMECIDEIAKLAGTGDQVSQITASAMRGELDFEQSLRQRVATLQDAPERILQQVREYLPLMPGLKPMIAALQKYGWKIAIASGGFTYFADYLQQQLGLDYAVSNQFEICNGKLTGKVQGDIVHAQYKADTLLRLAAQWHIPLQNTVAIGDGANDLPMIHTADLGVAFHAKPKVQQQAKVVVNYANLTGLLCLLSARDRFN
ncbi:MAG: phosphoserine phosphatase [Pasteurellaceae bacterium]|nr:phosphoserine phosphatase [Pasteurellaceae bacterium]